MSRGWALVTLAVMFGLGASIPQMAWLDALSGIVYILVLLHVGYRYLRGDRLRWEKKR